MSTVNIDLRITLTAQEQAAWQLIKPKLKAYLLSVITAYRRANATQKAYLRAHNPVLDQLVDFIGER